MTNKKKREIMQS